MKPFLQFFFFLIIAVQRLQCKEDQQLSLLHFKNSLVYNSSISSKLISWNSSTDCCSWVGVTCSTVGIVIGLDLSRKGISIGIENSSNLVDLQHLQSLNLAFNDLVGVFPKEFFRVPSLETLDLSYNPELQGSLPEFPNNGSLQSLVLSETNFSGTLPNSIVNLEKLSTLDIADFSFSGSIAMSIGNLTQLLRFPSSQPCCQRIRKGGSSCIDFDLALLSNDEHGSGKQLVPISSCCPLDAIMKSLLSKMKFVKQLVCLSSKDCSSHCNPRVKCVICFD
ncbi:putative leucine-rich repeat-containing, plant-type, leucine-rich repeat domain, L [Rosa chinensis]|uniref:Putative leucine-rich repeat-containing, plant-type, leucine-rich repeat domain, L n=1 Tax=Rosa chinensis TaxID=74649 RepID=A0A2P6R960_ROSCH|nr:putative leucine-rich repeat-containing, plant-type, leucine-rich repeat domain, L [Rosa chinensis]